MGAAQRDETGKMTVSEAPLNIIRPWWMGWAVGFGTISLAIKHACGESFITGRNKAALPFPRVPTSPWKKPVSLATKLALFVTGMGKEEEEGGREASRGGVEWRHDSPR